VDVLVALLPPVVLIAIGLGVWALVRHPRFVVPAAWIVTALVVVIYVVLPLALPGPTPESDRLFRAAPALGFLVVLWLGVVWLRRRRSR
jgi:hypothetical protein